MTEPAVTLPKAALPLKTRRLILRDYQESDWNAVYAYVKEAKFWRYQAGEPPTEERVKALVTWAVNEQGMTPRANHYLAVVDRNTNEIVGEAVLRIVHGPFGQGEFGFGIAPAHWQKGYATEVGHALLDLAFNQFKLHRVAGQCAPDNKASIRVMQKLGMAREGHLREVYKTGDKWWSTVIYAVLDREYAKIRANKDAT